MLQTAALILAAGKGTRMHSDKPKVLQTVLGEPMLRYVLEAVRPVFDGRVLVVVAIRRAWWRPPSRTLPSCTRNSSWARAMR